MTQSDIRVESYCRFNLLRASVFNFELLNIFRDSIGLPRENLLSLELAASFGFKFRASRYITGLNRISELKVIVVCICYKLPFKITSVSIYYRTQSDIRVKRYCYLNFIGASVFNLERLNILWDLIGYPS